jgi:hypothetical protein
MRPRLTRTTGSLRRGRDDAPAKSLAPTCSRSLTAGALCSQYLPDRTRRIAAGRDHLRSRAGGWVSRPAPVPGRSEGCSSAPEADPSLRRRHWEATRSTSACLRVGPRLGALSPAAGRASCRGLGLPLGRPSPSRTSRAVCAALLVGDPGAGRSRAPHGAAALARAAQSWREPVLTGALGCVPPADRRRSGLGSCRTTRRALARPGGRPQTDAIHDPSGRRRSAVRRFLSRSGLRYATEFSLHHRRSIAPSWPGLDSRVWI